MCDGAGTGTVGELLCSEVHKIVVMLETEVYGYGEDLYVQKGCCCCNDVLCCFPRVSFSLFLLLTRFFELMSNDKMVATGHHTDGASGTISLS